MPTCYHGYNFNNFVHDNSETTNLVANKKEAKKALKKDSEKFSEKETEQTELNLKPELTLAENPSLLAKIRHPSDLQHFSEQELEILAIELRNKIINTVSQTGGHLAPSLGVIELTLALVTSLDLEKDRLIWDVGHQCYAYKLLTGRNDNFESLRQYGGLSGFPRLEESPFDHFGTGHASTSISAALGMALARDLANKKHHVVAVIGDGALTGGMAFEGLNLAGDMGKRLIVILNDNEISISQNVGALSCFLSRAFTRRWARQARKDTLAFLRSIPRIGNKLATYAMRGELSIKSLFTPGMLFEALKFAYIGPVAGHDLTALRQHLKMALEVEDGPVLLHIRTTKGKGYAPAECDPSHFHGVSSFHTATGALPKKGTLPSYTQIFSQTLVELAKKDDKILAITAAMADGTGTDLFAKHFPERFFDVGICEQHAVTFAAGLASQGYKPVVAIYSTFLQRAYDQIIHDVCLQNLKVCFCIDRAGLVGEDGATHHGVFDLAYLRHIPNLYLIAPRNENILRHALNTALNLDCACAIRYPKGQSLGLELDQELKNLRPGQGEFVKIAKNLNQENEQNIDQAKNKLQIAILACGQSAEVAIQAATKAEAELEVAITVFDPIWIKPLPEAQIKELASQFQHLIIIEEGCLAGGFSSAILELLADHNLLAKLKIKRLGIGDNFVTHGKQAELREQEGLDATGILEAIYSMTKTI